MAVDGHVVPVTLNKREGFSRFSNDRPSPEECTDGFVRMSIVATKEDLTEQSQEEGSGITVPLQNLIPVATGEWRYESHDIWRFWANPAAFENREEREFGGPTYS